MERILNYAMVRSIALFVMVIGLLIPMSSVMAQAVLQPDKPMTAPDEPTTTLDKPFKLVQDNPSSTASSVSSPSTPQNLMDWRVEYFKALIQDVRRDMEAQLIERDKRVETAVTTLNSKLDAIQQTLNDKVAAIDEKSTSRRDSTIQDIRREMTAQLVDRDKNLEIVNKNLADKIDVVGKMMVDKINEVDGKSITRHDDVVLRMNAKDANYIQHFTEIEKNAMLVMDNNKVAADGIKEQTAAASAAQKDAINKNDAATEKRFESVNEFRGQLKDQAATLVTRIESNAVAKAISDKVDILSNQIIAMQARMEGAGSLWGYIVGALGVAAAFIVIYFNRMGAAAHP